MNTWRTDKPEPGRYVLVWTAAGAEVAQWTGKVWRTIDGLPLTNITHWCELPAAPEQMDGLVREVTT